MNDSHSALGIQSRLQQLSPLHPSPSASNPPPSTSSRSPPSSTAVYFILGWWFTPLMVAILVAAILLPLAFPHRYEDLISALSWLAIAALAWFYFGAQPLAVIAGLIGLFSLFAALTHRGATPS